MALDFNVLASRDLAVVMETKGGSFWNGVLPLLEFHPQIVSLVFRVLGCKIHTHTPGPAFIIKMSLSLWICHCRYGDFHYKDHLAVRPSYLCNGNSYARNSYACVLVLKWTQDLFLKYLNSIKHIIIFNAITEYFWYYNFQCILGFRKLCRAAVKEEF